MNVGPVAGAAVMGSGIVSTATLLTGHRSISTVVLAVACVMWLALAGILVQRLLSDPAAVRHGEHQPAALTAVAGTAVLGARFTTGGTPGLGWAALTLAGVLWLILLAPVLRALPPRGVTGAAFLLTVATAALAVVIAALAKAEQITWLAIPGVALVALALGLYLDVLRRFAARRELLNGRGDHWIAGGALAICALALALLAQAVPESGYELLHGATLVAWLTAVAWLPALVAGELVRPRLRYHPQRWATVFPLGMYVAATAALATAWPSAILHGAARAGAWVAVAVWILTLAGLAPRVVEAGVAQGRARLGRRLAADS